MNLAQLIDPERVQRGLEKEQQEVRPAPCPPLGTVLHDADTRVGETRPPPPPPRAVQASAVALATLALAAMPPRRVTLGQRILQVLADTPHTLRVREITQRLGEHVPRNPNTVAAALGALYEQRMVERDSTYEFFLYSITDAGRKKLGGQ